VLSDVVQRQAARRAAPVKFMQQKTLLALVQSFFTVAEPQQGMSPLTILSYRDPRLVTRALEVALRAVFGFQRRQARRPAREPRTGAVTFVQRFGGALNLNVHGYRSPPSNPMLFKMACGGRRFDPGMLYQPSARAAAQSRRRNVAGDDSLPSCVELLGALPHHPRDIPIRRMIDTTRAIPNNVSTPAATQKPKSL
jgi:hypothetical protein